MGNSNDKLFSSLSKLSNTSNIETDDGPVQGQGNENKTFAIFCAIVTILGLISFVLVLMLRGHVHPLIFQTLFVVMCLFVPSIAMSGFLKSVHFRCIGKETHTFCNGHYCSFCGSSRRPASVDQSWHYSNPITRKGLVFEGYEQLYLLTFVIALAVILLASLVLLVAQYKRKWLLALASFAVFLFVLYLEINVIAFFRWFPEL